MTLFYAKPSYERLNNFLIILSMSKINGLRLSARWYLSQYSTKIKSSLWEEEERDRGNGVEQNKCSHIHIYMCVFRLPTRP